MPDEPIVPKGASEWRPLSVDETEALCRVDDAAIAEAAAKCDADLRDLLNAEPEDE